MASNPVINGGSQPEKPSAGKLFASVWVRGALVVAVLEAVLIAVGVIPRWAAVVIAGIVIAAYFLRGRTLKNPSARQGAWAAALSQAIVLFVPIIWWIIGAAAIVILAVVAAIILIVLIVDR